MNKKILLSLLIIGIIASVASAGTWAYFSDVKSTQQSTLEAGKLQLNEGIATTTLFETNDLIVPGAPAIDSYLYVENAGTIPGDLYVRIHPSSNNKELLNYVTVGVSGTNVESKTLSDTYQKIADLGSNWDGRNLVISCSMADTQTQGQGTTAAFSVDFLLVQDGITDLTKFTASQLNNQ